MPEKEIKREQVEVLLRMTPGPSPWYLQGRGPIIDTKYGATSWESAGDDPVTAGKTVLHTEREKNLAVFDFQHWVSSFNGKFLLAWNQLYQFEKGCLTLPVTVRLYDPNLFVPFDSLEEVCQKMKAEKRNVYQKGGEILSFELPTVVAGEVRSYVFPEPISKIEELLIPCHSSGIVYDGSECQNFGLLMARPSRGNFEIIPQDWFNTANLDFGYQWVTQFARHPRTGKIVGGGIRILYFVLSDNFRQVDRWFR
ncbi:MAG: hypothetical protein ABSC89_04015 [Verrucomicrobiota bacterium]|jgi:hypothetical protein